MLQPTKCADAGGCFHGELQRCAAGHAGATTGAALRVQAMQTLVTALANVGGGEQEAGAREEDAVGRLAVARGGVSIIPPFVHHGQSTRCSLG